LETGVFKRKRKRECFGMIGELFPRPCPRKVTHGIKGGEWTPDTAGCYWHVSEGQRIHGGLIYRLEEEA
jgi:hypothetical protein